MNKSPPSPAEAKGFQSARTVVRLLAPTGGALIPQAISREITELLRAQVASKGIDSE